MMTERKILPEYITIANTESNGYVNNNCCSVDSDMNSNFDDGLSEISFNTRQLHSSTLPSSLHIPAPVPVEDCTHKISVESDFSLLSFASRRDLSLLSFDDSTFGESADKEPAIPSVVAISNELSKHNHEWWSSFTDEFSTLPSTCMSYLVSSYESLTTSSHLSSTISTSEVLTPPLIDDDLSLSSSDDSIQLEHIETKFRSILNQYFDRMPTMSLKRSMVEQCIQSNSSTDYDDSSMKRRCSNLIVLQSLWS